MICPFGKQWRAAVFRFRVPAGDEKGKRLPAVSFPFASLGGLGTLYITLGLPREMRSKGQKGRRGVLGGRSPPSCLSRRSTCSRCLLLETQVPAWSWAGHRPGPASTLKLDTPPRDPGHHPSVCLHLLDRSESSVNEWDQPTAGLLCPSDL